MTEEIQSSYFILPIQTFLDFGYSMYGQRTNIDNSKVLYELPFLTIEQYNTLVTEGNVVNSFDELTTVANVNSVLKDGPILYTMSDMQQLMGTPEWNWD